jgi:hypothetical protein
MHRVLIVLAVNKYWGFPKEVKIPVVSTTEQ